MFVGELGLLSSWFTVLCLFVGLLFANLDTRQLAIKSVTDKLEEKRLKKIREEDNLIRSKEQVISMS